MPMEQLLSIAKFEQDNLKSVEGDLSASFSRDKKPRSKKFKADKDNGFKKLHPARFERYPLGDIKSWYKKVPRIRSHQFKSLPLQFSGSHNKVTLKTIQAMHDRTKILTFKMFHAGNINVGSKPIQKVEKRDESGIYSSLDYCWESPSSLSQVSDALLNYSVILLHLWPYDQTGLILQRLVNKYNYFSCAATLTERVNLVATFFNTVLRENAARAGRKEVIMSFQEQEDALKNVLTAAGLSNSVPTGRIPRLDIVKPKYKQGPSSTFTPTASLGQSNRNKVVLVGGHPICFNFNNGSCRNAGSPIGCKDARNKEYVYQCNKWDSTKNAYCLARHPRVKH